MLRKGNPETFQFIQCLLDSAYIQLTFKNPAFEITTFFLVDKLIFHSRYLEVVHRCIASECWGALPAFYFKKNPYS